MSLILSGTDGLSDVDGTAAAPAIRGTDANTGIFFPAADTIAFAEGGSEVARFDSSGQMGIGTTTPSAKLEVSGSGTLELARFATTTDNTPSIGIYSNGSIRAKLRASSAETALLSQGALPLLLGTNNTERARIDSSGNLLVGRTSQTAAEKLSVYTGTASTNTAYLWYGETDDRAGVIFRHDRAAGVTSAKQCAFLNQTAAEVGSINSTGSATSYATSSDYRLKHDIQPMTGALAKVTQLKPVTYKWNIDNSESQGFIAHELQEVVPECVVGEKNAVETYTDEDGNEATRPAYQGIDTSFLVATLTAAIQEQQALITALTTRITALEAA